MPPKPLNSATISGIAVICTRRAAAAPIAPPTAKPIRIHWYSTMPWSSRAATIATSMPMDETMFPRLAVAGEPSCFRPKMNRAAEAT